jgi:hypothetical protein
VTLEKRGVPRGESVAYTPYLRFCEAQSESLTGKRRRRAETRYALMAKLPEIYASNRRNLL